jgi:hypothetical protein
LCQVVTKIDFLDYIFYIVYRVKTKKINNIRMLDGCKFSLS